MTTAQTNNIVRIYSGNQTLNDSFKPFFKYSSNADDAAFDLGISLFSKLSPFAIKNVFLNKTSSDSLFLRFSTINDFEFKLEVFFDYEENDDDDIQSTLHVYNQAKKEGSYYGDIDYLFSIINKFANNLYECYEFSSDFLEYNIENSWSGKKLSPAFNTYSAGSNDITQRFE